MKIIYGTHVPDLHRTVFFADLEDAETQAATVRGAYDLPGTIESVPVYDSAAELTATAEEATRTAALAKLTPEERAALGHPDPAPAVAAPAAAEEAPAVDEPAPAAAAKAAARKVAGAADQAAATIA